MFGAVLLASNFKCPFRPPGGGIIPWLSHAGFCCSCQEQMVPIDNDIFIIRLLHALNPEEKSFGFFTMMPQYILFGLLFGMTTILDDGIEIALGAHTANNVFNSIMVTSSSSVLQTPALYVQQKIYPWVDLLRAGCLSPGVLHYYEDHL